MNKTFAEIGSDTITFHDLYNLTTKLLYGVFSPECTGQLTSAERSAMADGVLSVVGAVGSQMTGQDAEILIPWMKDQMVALVTRMAAKEAGLL